MTHPQLVESLCKPATAIVADLSADPRKAHLWHMASALMAETGELFDTVKRHVLYGQPLNIDGDGGMVEELGDIEFYLEGIRKPLDITRGRTLAQNCVKLAKRYAQLSYSDTAATERLDKQTGQ